MVVFKINSKDADDLAGEFDTTPPPPIPEEKTRRAIQTPVLEPIQYMVSHGVHPLVHTRTFVEAYGKQLMDGARKEEQEERDNKLQWDRYLSQSPTMGSRMLMPSVSVSSIFRSTLDGLNQLFYQAMLAGKRGEDVDAIGIPAVILNNMIHLFQIGGANQFQELHKLYHYYLAQLKITVIDNDERTKELQDTLADLSHYVQDKVTSLHSELNTAASNLRHVLRRALAEEAAQARARMLIVWNGKCKRFVNVRPPEKSGSLGELYPNSLIGGILGGRYAEGSNYTVGNLSYTQEGQLFKTWEEVVHFYIDLYRPCWFRIDAAIMLNRNNWQQTTRSVYWTEWHDKYKSPKTNDYWDAYELFLETWEPKQGIERMWYTQAMLEAEIERRVSDAYHGIVNRSSAQSALESYVPFALQQEVGKEEMDIHSNQHKLTTIVSVATAEMEEQKKKIEYELEQLNKLAAAKPVYDAVVAQLTSELREILRELASPAGRVEGDSGIQEVVMGHGIQLSSAEMEARISNQLVSLPMSRFEKFALVKIAENIPQNPGKKCVSCAVVNNPGVLYCVQCQTRIIGANEYTIKTIKPPDVNTQLLEQRVKRILANNIRSGNVRERATVEAEITKRQTGCSGGAAPVHPPQQPSPQPPRHARQVPVQANCPNCGKSILPGSTFCNQCGMKLT